MTPCPVCESPNPAGASECANCGKAFLIAVVGDAPAATMLELDTGRQDASTIAVSAELMPDLDTARAAPVNVAVDVTPDMELGRSAPVANVVDDPTPDMEQTAIAAKEWTPESEGPVVCRACGTPQSGTDSIFCANCGRHLPIREAMQGAIISDGPVSANVEKVKCKSCGSRVYPAVLCSVCGIPLKLEG